jgi:chitodextrinase
MLRLGRRVVSTLVVLISTFVVVLAPLTPSAPATDATAPVLVAAVGDIACDPTDTGFNGGLGTQSRCRQKYTSDLVVSPDYTAVLTLGDNQYNSATLSNFQQSYDPSWGRVKAKTYPSIGNHEGTTATSGAGYCSYFGAAAHCNASGRQGNAAFYSFDLGGWHVIALNSNCTAAGGCGVGSLQHQWLVDDLRAHPAACTLAYWHHPRFSSGHGGSDTSMQAIWQTLYDEGADLVLTGHSHHYERFAPQDGSGRVDRTRGIRQFVVGTGGAFFTGMSTVVPNSEVRQNTTFGVLQVALHPSGYEWKFVPEAGRTFSDAGTETCHGKPQPDDTSAPSAPANLAATAVGSGRVELAWSAASDNVGVVGYEIWRDGALLATTSGSGTTYADTSVSAGTSYRYAVKARDAAGNVSGASNEATATTPASLSFAPEADAYVSEASPSTNYGSSVNLRADGATDPDVESFLRFTVSGLSGGVQSAKLRLYAWSATGNGPALYPSGSSWSESTITWNTRPARTGTVVADAASIPAASWVEYDVTPLVTGNGTVSFTLAPQTTDGVDFYSREGTTKPELIVTPAAG